MQFSWAKPHVRWMLWGLVALLCTSNVSCAQQEQEPPKAVTVSAANKGDVLGAAAALEDFFNRRYTGDKGIHLESVLSAIGASAGFGTQMAIREAYIKPGKITEKQAFVVVGTNDGKKYYYGDPLNKLLFEAPTGSNTVWGIVSGGAKYVGARELPDIKEIVGYNAKTLGTPAFGIPRHPKGHEPREAPLEALQNTWPEVRAILDKHQIEPQLLGWVYAVAAQKVIIQKSKKIDPALAAKIVMESALPMSKVDPDTVIKH